MSLRWYCSINVSCAAGFVCRIGSLEELHLAHNYVQDIPPDISRLKRLLVLDVRWAGVGVWWAGVGIRWDWGGDQVSWGGGQVSWGWRSGELGWRSGELGLESGELGLEVRWGVCGWSPVSLDRNEWEYNNKKNLYFVVSCNPVFAWLPAVM